MIEDSGAELARIRALTVWRDGALVLGDQAVSVWDHGLLYGDGVFEGIRLRDGRLYRIDLHLRRLARSSHILQIELRYSESEILRAIAQVADANGLTDAHVRILHTRGVGLPGLDPRRCSTSTLLVLAYPFPPYLGSEPLSLIISSVARKAPRSIDASVKSLNYLDGVLAKLQANAAGADDAIMLDGEGYIAEATAANIFVVRDKQLRTPPTTAALPGITRQTVLELAPKLSISATTERLTSGDIYAADEVFLTGTAAGIVPVGRIDNRTIADAPGPITDRFGQAYVETWTDRRLSRALTSVGGSSSPGRSVKTD